jgi:glycosyltransferase involved in cell wall biosynthesis
VRRRARRGLLPADSARPWLLNLNMRILINAVGRDIHPTGICRVASNHARALLSKRPGAGVLLVIGAWQQELYRSLLGSFEAECDLMVAPVRNRSLARNLWFSVALPALANEWRADLVHLAYPVPVLRRRFSSPVVVTLHDMYPYDSPATFGFPNFYANRAILRECLGSVDGVACVSGATRSRLDALLPQVARRVPVVTTGNYVRLCDNPPLAPSFTAEIQPRQFILSVAQHRSNKNLDLLLRAFAALDAAEPATRSLVIVGSEGPETPNLHSLAQSLAVTQRVKFVQSLRDEELLWLYRECSLVAIPSRAEGYCLPAAEAIAAGARVVCSDIPILREVCGTDCEYFSLAGDSSENLASAIRSVLAAPAPSRAWNPDLSEAETLSHYLALYGRVLPPHADPVRSADPS